MVCMWVRYTWWHNGGRLDLNEEYIRPLSHGHIEITLESSLAEGTYQCEASNQHGTEPNDSISYFPLSICLSSDGICVETIVLHIS